MHCNILMKWNIFGKKNKELVVSKPSVTVPPNAIESYSVGDTKIAIVGDQYTVLFPPIPSNFDNILEETIIIYSGLKGDDEEEKLLRAFLEVASKRNLDADTVSSAWYHLRYACLYYGKISPLLVDHYIEDISCSGPDKPVFVYHQKHGFIPSNIVFEKRELYRFIHSLAQKSGFVLSSDSPIIDATLPDGSRINIVLDVAKDPSFTIRKVKTQPLTPKFLVENKTWSPEIAALIWLALENKCSLMFVGGTATGKSTAMNASAFFIPPYSKIVSIEDTYELMLPHKNWTAMIVKENTSTHELLKASLRQRPEYIIIGEARSIEVREMFSAMGVGHAVLTTFHGANAVTVARRLFGEPFQIKSDQFRLLDFIVVMATTTNRRRVCRELVMVDVEGDVRLVADVFGKRLSYYDENSGYITNISPAFERIAEKGMKDVKSIQEEYERKLKLVNAMPSNLQEFIKFMNNLNGEQYAQQ